MEPYVIAAVLVLLAIWYSATDKRDRVIYEGPGFATCDDMKHYSKTTRWVHVVFNEPIGGEQILSAEVSLSTASRIKASVVAHPVHVTVSQRVGERPRITSLAA